ncbi:hypothetical protein C8J57DRAFT_1458408 [Mycena rebaudengoi]|nr:hypothetical protein C8J57DRAFT_1458408 [Mycena rebaudengoi]
MSCILWRAREGQSFGGCFCVSTGLSFVLVDLTALTPEGVGGGMQDEPGGRAVVVAGAWEAATRARRLGLRNKVGAALSVFMDPNLPPSDPQWRNNGQKYDQVPTAVRGFVRQKLEMSPLYRRLLLPHPRLDVLNLSRYLLPPMATDAAHYNHIPSGHEFFSKSNSDDQVDIDLLKQMLVPPPSLIGQLRQESRQRYLDGYESICLPDGTLLPIWVLDMWSELQVTVQPNVDGWAAGIKWLRQTSSKKEVNETLRILGCLCWTGLIPTDPIHKQKRISSAQSVGYSVLHLTKFLSRDWFSCQEIDQMLDVIWDDIKEAGRDNVQMMDTALTTEIITQYEKSRFEEEEAYDPTADNWLARFGRELKQNTELAGIFHVGGNHWIGTTVDVGAESIGYGDPLDPSGGLFDTNVCDALRWFTRHHVSSGADTPLSLIPTTLACTLQADDWNCGLFAPNAIGHEFLPEMYPLLTSDIALGDVGRLTMLQRIIRKYHAAVSTIIRPVNYES